MASIHNSSQPLDALETEARLFTHYLVNRDASPQAIQLYKLAMSGSRPNSADRKLLRFMVSRPWSIGFIDAGLVFHNASSEARRRLYVMFAILEASPDYTDLFLAERRSPWYLLTVAYTGIKAVAKAVVGLLLVKVIR